MAGVSWLIQQVPMAQEDHEEQAAKKRGLGFLRNIVKAPIKSSSGKMAEDGDADQPCSEVEMDDWRDEQHVP